MINPIKETISMALRLPLSSATVGLIVIAGLCCPAFAETLVDYSIEDRLQLDLHVPDAALKTLIPAGFEPNIATQGPAKDANIRVIFVDRIGVAGTDGNPVGKGATQFVYLAVPVKVGNSGATAQLVVAGLASDPADVPGPFGVYTAATTHKVVRTTMAGSGSAVQTEEMWDFAGAGGETLQLHVVFDRVPVRRTTAEVRVYSGEKPDFMQIWKQEQGLDIARNATTGVDRVQSIYVPGLWRPSGTAVRRNGEGAKYRRYTVVRPRDLFAVIGEARVYRASTVESVIGNVTRLTQIARERSRPAGLEAVHVRQF